MRKMRTPALVLFDLPAGVILTLSGVRQKLSRPHDMLILTNLPLQTFCLFTLRYSSDHPSSGCGLVLYFTNEQDLVARRYNPQSEELDDIDLRDAGWDALRTLTSASNNTDDSHASISMDGKASIMLAEDFVKFHGKPTLHSSSDMDTKEAFPQTHIHSSVLNRLSLLNGSKIIPGSSQSMNNKTDVDAALKPIDCQVKDGSSISYHPIPCVFPFDKNSGLERRSFLSHTGTKSYLSLLTTSERTQLLMAENPSSSFLDDVLRRVYSSRFEDVIGELDMAFNVFLGLNCMTSFEHWRDLIAMMCFAVSSNGAIYRYPLLYGALIPVLSQHLESIDVEFFEEIEISGNNFLIPALKYLITSCFTKTSNLKSFHNRPGIDRSISSSMERLVLIISERFSINMFSLEENQEWSSSNNLSDMMDYDNADQAAESGDSDDDGPIIVPLHEIEESKSRAEILSMESNSKRDKSRQSMSSAIDNDAETRMKFPLLFSSVSPKEDILMTCARVLDEKKDASLVREAAAYLEDLESLNNL